MITSMQPGFPKKKIQIPPMYRMEKQKQFRPHKWRGLIIAILLGGAPAITLAGCRNTTRVHSVETSSAGWAEPIDHPGLPNFHKINDDLYRGAQPSQQGLNELRALGVMTVVNVRADDRTRPLATQAHLQYEHIPMSAWGVNDEQIIRFLRLFGNDRLHTPVFVHCHHGSDRTGVLCAMYRVAVQGWSKAQAIDEMTQGGMGFHPLCENLARYVRQADVDEIRRAAGLAH
jgi:protein tyrosine/serine phosphatase